jgi:hypothetical protein
VNKGMPFRTSAGIPHIVRFPGKVQGGKIIKSATSTVDFAPTILSLLGVSDHGVQFDGIDVSEELTSTSLISNDDRTTFLSYKYGFAAVRKNMKLVVSKANDVPYLFDLDADPFEVENVFDNRNYAEVQELLLNELLQSNEDNKIVLEDDKFGMLWSTPACLDSSNRIKFESEFYTCEDIGSSRLSFDRCSEQLFIEHCPVTCKACCQDSIGKVWFKEGGLRGCDDLEYGFKNGKKICKERKKMKLLCPLSCKQCKK